MLGAFTKNKSLTQTDQEGAAENSLGQNIQASNQYQDSLNVIIAPWYTDNPYQQKLADQLTQKGHKVTGVSCSTSSLLKTVKNNQADVLHLHWLHHFFLEEESGFRAVLKLCLFIVQLFILRFSKVNIVWTIHNLKNHQNKYLLLDNIASFLVAHIVHKLIVHSETAKTEVAQKFCLTNQQRIHVLPHANYIGSYPNTTTRQDARRSLNLPESGLVLLFLGTIHPYKGVADLLQAFKKLNSTNTYLVIAGKVKDQGLADELTTAAKNDAHVRYLPGFIPDEQLQIYMNVANTIVFPYREFLTSGAVILAMSFGKACIAPRRGHIGEVLDDVGAFLYDPDLPDGLLQALHASMQPPERLDKMGQHNYQVASHWTWDMITEKTLAVYQ
ncbi:glycosyltransferase family 4 protein [Adonisia turfae]|nr:glycosyltransferase family 4 protein [Adonisia turfae]